MGGRSCFIPSGAFVDTLRVMHSTVLYCSIAEVHYSVLQCFIVCDVSCNSGSSHYLFTGGSAGVSPGSPRPDMFSMISSSPLLLLRKKLPDFLIFLNKLLSPLVSESVSWSVTKDQRVSYAKANI